MPAVIRAVVPDNRITAEPWLLMAGLPLTEQNEVAPPFHNSLVELINGCAH